MPQVPVTAGYGLLAHGLRARHAALDAVVDTRRIGDHERRAGISLGLLQHVEQLHLRSADRNLCHVYVAVGHGDGAEVFLADALTGRSELGNGTHGRRFRRLAAGIRVNLRIDHQDVDVGTRCEHVVDTAETDVVAPAVAADNPLRLLHQPVLHLQDILAVIAAAGLHHRDEARRDLGRFGRRTARGDPLLHDALQLVGAFRTVGNSLLHPGLDAVAEFLDAEVHTQAEFGVVLEERVRPCRALALVVGAVRGRRCRARIDRGAARGVGNHHLVAEQLRDSLDIGGLAATGAGARELEQRLCELEVLHRLGLVDDLLVSDVLGDVVPVLLLGHLRLERFHHQCLLLGRADVDAVRATRTVERRDLDAELVLLGLAQPLLPFHARCGGLGLRRKERADHGVRADIGALVALDTVFDLPLGNVHGDAAFLVGGRAVLPRTVLTARESRYRQVIALQPVDRLDDLAHEFGTRSIRDVCEALVVDLRPFGRHLDLLDGVAAGVDGRIVHVDDVLALHAVGLLDGLLHLVDSLVERDDVGDLEERRLHDRVGTRAQPELGGDLRGVDDIEIDLVLGQIGFHVVRQRGAGGSRVVHRVEQERTAGFQPFQHVVLIDVRRHVARHEVGRGDQVGRSDRQVAETQVRRGVTARFLRVVREVCLAVLVRRTADDLDRVLVGPYRTVGTQAEEERLERTGLCERNLLAHGQRAEGHVVHDAHRKLVLGLVGPEVGEHGQHLRRRGVFGRKAVAAADDERFAVGRNILAVGKCLDDIQVERVAVCTRFLSTVEHTDALHRFGQHLAQVFHREGTIEVNGHDAHLPATGVQVVDRLPEGFGHRTHRNHDVLGVLGPVVYEGLVLAAGDLRNLAHRLGDHVGHGVVEAVGGLAGLEIDVGVLRRTAGHGVLGVERTLAEGLERVAVEHRR